MDLNNLPQSSGIYQFFDANDTLLYIGKAIHIKARVRSYFQKNITSPRTKKLVSHIARIKTIKTESEFDALLLEAKLIHAHQPKYNVIWRDDKHPLYIKITKDQFPKIMTSRQDTDTDAVFYGPFPSARIVKDTLKYIRHIFPYCTDKTIKTRACFYSHIGLCDPCPNIISTAKEKKEYMRNITLIKKLLNGNSKALIRQLTRQMNKLAQKNDFENAQKIKEQIQRLEYLRRKRTPIKEYLKNPNHFEDVRSRELEELAKLLGISRIRRIEGYDISNTQGTYATGSMVSSMDGAPDKSLYRRFRIRRKSSPDDTYMMHEVLVRRLRHTEWTYPDLIVVDGGKGQISAGLHALEILDLAIPLIGLAKREEEILQPQPDGSYKSIKIPHDSPALHVIQRLRNEAHRFANTYHRKLRTKALLESNT